MGGKDIVLTDRTHLATEGGPRPEMSPLDDGRLREPAATPADAPDAVLASVDPAEDGHLARINGDEAAPPSTIPAETHPQSSLEDQPPDTETRQNEGSHMIAATTPDDRVGVPAVVEGDHRARTDDHGVDPADGTEVVASIGGGTEGPTTNGKVRSKRSAVRRRQRPADEAAVDTREDIVDSRPQAVEEAIANADDKNASLGPLVRHLNTLTLHLAEAHRAIGRLTAERDALRRHLAELQGLPIPDDDSRPDKETRVEVRQERQEARAEAKAARVEVRGGDPSAMTPEEIAEWRASVAWRRRLIAGGVLAVLVAGFVIANQMDFDLSGKLSRQGLATIPYLGNLMSIFIAAWIIYRIARVGGKGARWLFPSDQELRRRKR